MVSNAIRNAAKVVILGNVLKWMGNAMDVRTVTGHPIVISHAQITAKTARVTLQHLTVLMVVYLPSMEIHVSCPAVRDVKTANVSALMGHV